MVAKDAQLCTFTINENTKVYIFGREPLSKERTIYRDFVSPDKKLVEDAKTRWFHQKFDKVPGETESVPSPEQQNNFKLKK